MLKYIITYEVIDFVKQSLYGTHVLISHFITFYGELASTWLSWLCLAHLSRIFSIFFCFILVINDNSVIIRFNSQKRYPFNHTILRIISEMYLTKSGRYFVNWSRSLVIVFMIHNYSIEKEPRIFHINKSNFYECF